MQHRGELGRVVDRPVLLRLETDPRAVGAATLVGVAVARRRRPGGRGQLGDGQARLEDPALESGHVLVCDQLVVDRGHGVLPQLRLRDPRAEVARDGAHVAVQQLVPGLGERLRELVRVLQEAPRDRLVDRVEAQRQVRRQHHRGVPDRGVVGVGDGIRAGAVLRLPLLGAGRALGELPLVAEQGLEVAVVPRGRSRGPGTLETARDRVLALAGAEGVLPAEALVVHRAALGLGTDQVGVPGTVALAERVAARDERDRLLVVHRHPAEGLPDVPGGRQGIRVAVGALRVHVDQAHLHGAERTAELPLAAVPLVSEPGVLRSPEDLLGLPDVLSPEGEAERLEAHGLQGDVAGEDQEVGPGELPAVLLLDRPQQPAGLVQARVVGPAVQGSEALGAVAGSAPAVLDAVGAGGVPAHPDEEGPVVAVVGRPPVLRRGHHVDEVPLEPLEVERADLLGIVEVLTQGVGLRRVLVENLQVQLVRPPVLVRPGASRARRGGGDCRVLAAAFGHVGSPVLISCTVNWLLLPQRTRDTRPSR